MRLRISPRGNCASLNSLEKTLMLGGIGGRRRRGRQRIRCLDGITDLMDMSLGELRKLVMDREAWRAVIHGVAKSRTWLRDWTELNWTVPGQWGYWYILDIDLISLPYQLNWEGACQCSSVGKESTCNIEDLGSIPELGRSPGEGNGNPLQYSCLENPMDRGAW